MRRSLLASGLALVLAAGLTPAPARAAALAGPVVAFSSYLGGAGNDTANAVAVDRAGGVVIVGETRAPDFPLAGRATTLAGGNDAFATKLDRSGALVYSIYLGGTLDDRALGVAVDAAGAAYVTGVTRSTDFPVTAGALQRTYGGGGTDAFVVKLNATGEIVYSTYLGGNDWELGHDFETDIGIAVDSAGSAYVAGATTSSDFPVTAGAYQTACLIPCWQNKPFVAKLDPAGSALTYATYVGAGYGTGIAVDGVGNAYITGRAFAPFPSVSALPVSGDGDDAFVAKLDTTGSTLLYASTFGGGGSDEGKSIAVDATGSAYVVGVAGCRFPTTAGAFQPAATVCSSTNSFVVKVAPSGATLTYSSELGGRGFDLARSVAVDDSGHAYVAGFTTSPDFPIVGGSQATYGGSGDGFMIRVGASGSAIEFSTYVGGTAAEQANGVAVSAGGSAYTVGRTTSTDFPTHAAFQPAYGAGSCPNPYLPWILDPCIDGFVAGFRFNSAPVLGALAPATISEGQIFSAIGMFADPDSSSWTASVDYGDGGGAQPLALAEDNGFHLAHRYADNGSFNVVVRVTDDGGMESSGTALVTVINVAPSVTIDPPSVGVFPVGGSFTATGTFTDPGTADTHTASWTLGGRTLAGLVTESGGNGTASITQSFDTAGVYSIALTITDKDGASETASLVNGGPVFIVVYDPATGFVTGGGWISSPPGAYRLDPSAVGRATFGFVSKYQKGLDVPTGQTEFVFRVGNLDFHSTSYEWLIVSGAQAQYAGTGKANGIGGFSFTLTATDGDAPGGGGHDMFRIRIVDTTTGATVYDNETGTPGSDAPATQLGGGNIVLRG